VPGSLIGPAAGADASKGGGAGGASVVVACVREVEVEEGLQAGGQEGGIGAEMVGARGVSVVAL
jgi:hypothetical protein